MIRLPLSGVLNMASAPEVLRRVHRAVASAPRGTCVVLDLDDVVLLAAAGLTTLVAARQFGRAVGVPVRFVCTQPRLVKLIRQCGLEDELPVHHDAPTAVRGLPPAPRSPQ
ncbi:STAS domain-containing protein [Allokutzneria albata]|uniref:Anti-anti-sigma factor n=2 Tax=Allokutzneria albata TaxID=211114 RepID=A0A1G9SLS4_ALLAB|nr:STAS domain-containing protein [Allokutzneria albata]SDM36381.1 anti-anti-sigma factor [Allokutzneria albata]